MLGNNLEELGPSRTGLATRESKEGRREKVRGGEGRERKRERDGKGQRESKKVDNQGRGENGGEKEKKEIEKKREMRRTHPAGQTSTHSRLVYFGFRNSRRANRSRSVGDACRAERRVVQN